MRRGSFKSRLPQGRHRGNRYNSYIAPALACLAFLSLIIASSFIFHVISWPPISGSHSNSSQNDLNTLKIATSDSDLIATVSFSRGDGMTKVQVENAGSSELKRVEVMSQGGRVLGVLSQLAPNEKKILATKGDLNDVAVTAIDSSDKEVSGDVRYSKEANDAMNADKLSAKQPEPQKNPGLMGGASPSPEEHLSIQAAEEQPKPAQPDQANQNALANPNSEINSKLNLKLNSKFNISITTNKSSGYQGEVVEYGCRAVNVGNDTLSDVRLFCGEQMTSTTYLISGKEISLKGILAINSSLNISAGVQGKDTDGRLWTGNATAMVWMASPALRVNVAAPDKVHRGQSISLAVDIANTGSDRISNLSISDSFGDLGTIPILLPGESRRFTRNISLDETIQYMAQAVGQNSSGMEVYASSKSGLKVFTSGLDISTDQSEVTSYSNQPVDITWTLKNTGEERLKNITLSCDGKRCRLQELPAGSSAKIEGVYVKENASTVNVTAEGYDPEGNIVGSTGYVLINTISPGISLKVMPPEIEACKGEAVDISCLVTNTGDDPLTDVMLRQGDRTLATVDYLAPGEFRVTSTEMVIDKNTTFEFDASGKDSNGRRWDDSVPFKATIATTGIRASASATLSGDTASITCKVRNFGNVALYNAFVLSKVFGPLGTIDYLPPKGERLVSADEQFKSDVDDSISVEAFTFEKNPVHTSCRLIISLPKRYPSQGNAQPTGTRRMLSGLGQGYADSSGHSSAADIPERSNVRSAINNTATSSGKDLLSGIEGMIRYIQIMLGHAGSEMRSNIESTNSDNADAYSKTNYDSNNEASSPSGSSEGMNASRDYELSIASIKGSEHGAISILDVSASPSQPAAGQAVKISVHSKSSNAIKSAKAKWGISDAPLTKQDMMDIDRIHAMPMTLESGDSRDGYWSCTIPGRIGGTYMVLSVAFADGSASSEDGPYLLHWSTVRSSEMPEQAARRAGAVGPSGKGMLFIESTVVNGKGEVSIKDNVDDSAIHFNEKMKGNGSINLESEKRIDKSRPGTNFTQKRDLVFGGGVLSGQKSLESPVFDGGMGASITERFNLTHVDKSETDMVRNANYTYNTLAFSTDQAFDGNWNLKTQYAQFYRKMKADQQYTGSFQTQKKIEFDDHGQ